MGSDEQYSYSEKDFAKDLKRLIGENYVANLNLENVIKVNFFNGQSFEVVIYEYGRKN